MKPQRPTRLEKFHEAVDDTRGRRSELPVQRRLGPPPRRQIAVFAVWSTVAAVAACAAIGFGAPTVASEWDMPVLVGAGVVLAVAVRELRNRFSSTPRRARTVATTVAISAVALFGVGAATQLVLDGRPKLAVSADARSHDLVQELYKDLVSMTTADELIAYEQADARARYNAYQPAIDDLRSIANRWSRTDLGALPDPELIDVVQHVKVAATFGAEALRIRYGLITEPDVRAEQALAENRSAFVAETLAAGSTLRPLAERYRVDVGGQGRGE
jgi:hypothetical protein